ncbi:hypothetical protein ACFS32_04540 [Novosphingobium pokkalii]
MIGRTQLRGHHAAHRGRRVRRHHALPVTAAEHALGRAVTCDGVLLVVRCMTLGAQRGSRRSVAMFFEILLPLRPAVPPVADRILARLFLFDNIVKIGLPQLVSRRSMRY